MKRTIKKHKKKRNSRKYSARLVVSDRAWQQFAEILGQIKTKVGAPVKLSTRIFIEAILYIARTGSPWRDLPPCFGNWEAVYHRFRRWEKKGLWRRIWEILEQDQYKIARQIFIDSTVIRAHQHAAGARKTSGGQEAQALGRSCGGFSSKIHVGCVNEHTAVAIVLTAGQCNDAPVFKEVFESVPEKNSLEQAVMDKGYDSNEIRQTVCDAQITPVIPPRKTRKELIAYDKQAYKERNKVERFFNKIKQFRGIATRYQKLSSTFLSLIFLVSSFIIVR